MRLQNLAVIFVIIIMPISLLLSEYTQNRIQTISLQSKYDTKLIDATYDSLKAYQLNAFNSDTSDYINSRIRNVEAAANTFFNSMSSGFSDLGYSKTTLQNYIPALVFTMNDGYYIYTNYNNYWGNLSYGENGEISEQKTGKFKDGQEIYGLRPYVFYSCRYLRNGEFDVTITYSLDNYVQIQGYVIENGNKKTVSKYGYVLNGITKNGDVYTYRDVNISSENADGIAEKVLIEGDTSAQVSGPLSCIKFNGTKYYKENGSVFSVIKNKKIIQNPTYFTNSDYATLNKKLDDFNKGNNTNAYDYYDEAYNLKAFIDKYLSDLKVSDAVDEDGNKYSNYSADKRPYTNLDDKIFDYGNNNNIEKTDSNFNTHRREVIKESINKGLQVAITNYNASLLDENLSSSTGNNGQSMVDYDYRMPKLKETDWDKILNNISIISFMQGAKIGGKLYNGYAIVTNTQNEDLVTEDSIYIKNGNTLYEITDNSLKKSGGSITTGLGVFNVNTERKSVDADATTRYFIPVSGNLAYSSIVTHNGTTNLADNQTISEYVQSNLSNELQKIYFTALGRERQGLYREKLQINP